MALRVAIIGTGFGSSVQIPGFRRLEGVEVVAVASAHLQRARQAAARFGVPHAFDDYRAMLDAVDLDLVSVVSPPHLHHPMVMAALERGKHVICEKPFALTLAQAREMLQAAERRGVVHVLDHEFRYLPARSAFKERVEAGYLGQPRLVRVESWSDSRATGEGAEFDWWSEAEKGGGILGAIGSHYIDSLRWWFGEVRELSAALDTYVPSRRRADETPEQVTSDDTATLLLTLDAGVRATIHLTVAVARRGSRIEAYGSAGALVIERDERLLGAQGLPASAQLEELALPPRSFPPQQGEPPLVSPFAELARRVVARINGHSSPDFPTFHEGAAVQAVLDAVHVAAQQRRWVEPEAV